MHVHANIQPVDVFWKGCTQFCCVGILKTPPLALIVFCAIWQKNQHFEKHQRARLKKTKTIDYNCLMSELTILKYN